MSVRKKSILRVCGSCEWIFKIDEQTTATGCPKCHFGHYSAYAVYGSRAYTYARTQKPWYDKEVEAFTTALRRHIRDGKPLRVVANVPK